MFQPRHPYSKAFALIATVPASTIPIDAIASATLTSALGGADSGERWWLAVGVGLALGIALGLIIFQRHSRSLAVVVRRLTDLVGGMDGQFPEAVHRQSAAAELTRLAGEIAASARRNARDRAELQQRSAGWEAMFDAAPEAMFVLDADGRITHVNVAAARLFQAKREDSVGRLLSEVMLPPWHRSPGNSAFAGQLAAGKTHGRTQELVAQRADRRKFPVEVAIGGPGSGASGFIAVVRDISHVRRANAELNRLRRAAALNEARISADAERLEKGPRTAADDSLHGSLGRGGTAAPGDSRSRHVGPVLFALPRKSFTVEDVCGDAIRELAARADRRGLGFRYEDNALSGTYLLGDPARLRRVLINLIDTVVKAAEAGEIIVHLSAVAAEGDEVDVVAQVTATVMTEMQSRAMLRPFVRKTITRQEGGVYPGRLETHRNVSFLGTRLTHATSGPSGMTFGFQLRLEADLSKVTIDLSSPLATSAAPLGTAALQPVLHDAIAMQQDFRAAAARLREHAARQNLIALWAEAHRLRETWQIHGGHDDVGLVSALSHTARGGDAINAVLVARRLADALDAAAPRMVDPARLPRRSALFAAG
jgi:PAS domain S-box-containing protein